MTNKTVLTDYQIADLYIKYKDTDGISFGDIARAIEQAVLQSPEIQKLKRDSEMLDWLETEAQQSRSGVSLDYVYEVQDNYIKEKGFRFMRHRFIGQAGKTVREAIKSAMERQK